MRKHLPSRWRRRSSLLATPCRRRSAREIIEQVLVKVNGDIITKTELEDAPDRRDPPAMNQDVSPESLKNDEQLKKMLAEVTPRILVEAIDELLMVQLAKERGYRLRDEQFKEWLDSPPQGTEPRGRPEVPGGAEAGRA